MASDQIDKFHEEVCKWHLYDDIINLEQNPVEPTTKFYSSEEYLIHQKQLLLSDLKTQIAKHAPAMVTKFLRHPKAQFEIAHRYKLKKNFTFCLEFHTVKPEDEEMKTDKKRVVPPLITNHDLILAIKSDPDDSDIENKHMLCVVDSVVDDLVILKNVLLPLDAKVCDERNYNMYMFIKPQSQWTLLRVCSLENFNRSYVGFDSFQQCLLYKELLDLSQGVNECQSKFSLSCIPQNVKEITSLAQLSVSQKQIVEQCLATQGITAIQGPYRCGKTSLVPLIAYSLLQAESVIKHVQEESKAASKKFTIKELLENDSDSDEDMYDATKETQVVLQSQFPWHQTGYQSVFDENEGPVINKNQRYNKSAHSDKFIQMKPPQEKSPPPQRILIVSPASNAIDLLLDKFSAIANKVKIIRVGISHSRPDLNSKYALEVPKKDDPQGAVKVQQKIGEAQIVLTGTGSLRQYALEKTFHTFDTVIIDDASLVNEADCLAALRHGAIRLILLGNHAISQSLFLLRTNAANKSLFNRIGNFIEMTHPGVKQVAPSPSKSPIKGKMKKIQGVTQEQKTNIVFVDSSQSKEQTKKESFENPEEANAVADYLNAFKDSIDFSQLAVITPFRTQALIIKNVIQEVRKGDLDPQVAQFQTIGSFEDFVSRTFKTIVVSVCKTEQFEEQGGPLLNSQKAIDFLLSRIDHSAEPTRLVIISKSSSLNNLWRKTFYEADGVNIIEL